MKCQAALPGIHYTGIYSMSFRSGRLVKNLASGSLFTSLEVLARMKHPHFSGAFSGIGARILLSDTSLVCVAWNLAQALPTMRLRIFECTTRMKLFLTALQNNPINNCHIQLLSVKYFHFKIQLSVFTTPCNYCLYSSSF